MTPLPIDQSIVIALQPPEVVRQVSEGLLRYHYQNTPYRCVIGACPGFPEDRWDFGGLVSSFSDEHLEPMRHSTGLSAAQLRNLQYVHDGALLAIAEQPYQRSTPEVTPEALLDTLRRWLNGETIPAGQASLTRLVELSRQVVPSDPLA